MRLPLAFEICRFLFQFGQLRKEAKNSEATKLEQAEEGQRGSPHKPDEPRHFVEIPKRETWL
jgi:hypothetical protein